MVYYRHSDDGLAYGTAWCGTRLNLLARGEHLDDCHVAKSLILRYEVLYSVSHEDTHGCDVECGRSVLIGRTRVLGPIK